MKKLATLMVGVCLAAGMMGTALAVPFIAEKNGGVSLEPQMVFTVVTYKGDVDYDEVVMVWNGQAGQAGQFQALFVPNFLATNWRVEATPVSWWQDPIIEDGDQINAQENLLNDPFIYVGPLRQDD